MQSKKLNIITMKLSAKTLTIWAVEVTNLLEDNFLSLVISLIGIKSVPSKWEESKKKNNVFVFSKSY